MRYACLIYYDPAKLFDESPESLAVLAECQSHAQLLIDAGNHVASEALELPKSAMTVTMRDGKVKITDGPFMETREMLGGFVLIEARDLNEAVRIATEFPHARIGAVEVRPVVDFSQPAPTLADL